MKHRTLYLVGRTRVHLDRVQGLGHFMELEVVLEDHEPTDVGVLEADALMAQLGVKRSQPIETAYVDLLAQTDVKLVQERGSGLFVEVNLADLRFVEIFLSIGVVFIH